jgi:hypothetical protein
MYIKVSTIIIFLDILKKLKVTISLPGGTSSVRGRNLLSWPRGWDPWGSSAWRGHGVQTSDQLFTSTENITFWLPVILNKFHSIYKNLLSSKYSSIMFISGTLNVRDFSEKMSRRSGSRDKYFVESLWNKVTTLLLCF